MSARHLTSSRFLVRSFVAVAAVLVSASGCSSKSNDSKGASSTGGPAPTERRETVPCKDGAITLPVEAFDINPEEASGTTCNIGNVLDEDGSFAALDWSGDATHKIDGRDVTGCLAAEFGDGITIKSLSMKMRPVSSGCGHACTPGDEGCGNGWKLSVFAGPSLEELGFLQELELTKTEFFEYRIQVAQRFKAKFVAICRAPTPAAGDDLAIDSLYGFCN